MEAGCAGLRVSGGEGLRATLGLAPVATAAVAGRLTDSMSSQMNGAKIVALMNGTSIPIWAPTRIASSRPKSTGTIAQPTSRLAPVEPVRSSAANQM